MIIKIKQETIPTTDSRTPRPTTIDMHTYSEVLNSEGLNALALSVVEAGRVTSLAAGTGLVVRGVDVAVARMVVVKY